MTSFHNSATRSLHQWKTGLPGFRIGILTLTVLCWFLMPTLAHTAPNPKTIFFDDFEGPFPSGKWSAGADETGGSGCRWGTTYERASSGHDSLSPIALDCNSYRPVRSGPMPLNANIWLKYGPFDLSTHSTAEVAMRFAAELRGSHRIWIGHNLSNNCFYEPSSPFQGRNFYNGSDGKWSNLSLDISSRAGASNVCVYVVLSTDNTAGGSEHVFIDDFGIYADGGAPPVAGPELELHSIDVDWDEYYAGDQVPLRYKVTNHGDTASGAWNVDFWSAGRVEYYPFVGDHYHGTESGPSLAPGETRGFNTEVTSSNSLPGPGTWSLRGFLEHADSNQQNNVAIHAFSHRNLGVRGTVLLRETAEGAFPPSSWSLTPDRVSGCQWGKTSLAGNGSTSSLSPVASSCNVAVGALTGPLPISSRTLMRTGPIDPGNAISTHLTFRYWARMSDRNDFSVWTSPVVANACTDDWTFHAALRVPEEGWSNFSTSLTTGSGFCIQLDFRTYNTPNVPGDNWFLVDDVQVIGISHGLSIQKQTPIEGVYRAGDYVPISHLVENVGDESISDFSLQYSIKNFQNSTGTVVDEATQAGLNAGQSRLINRSLRIPPGTTPGNYSVKVSLDYNGNLNDKPTTLDGFVRVEGDPEISVTPLNLDMLMSPPPGAGANADSVAIINVEGVQSSNSPAAILRRNNVAELSSLARRDGKVDVIVELTGQGISPTVLKKKGQSVTRQQIRDSGDNLLQDMGARGLATATRYQYRSIPFIAMSVDEPALAFLASSPGIGSIVEDRAEPPSMVSSNAVIRSAEMWARNFDGTGQAVAVLDTGVDSSHPWFTNGSKIVAEACFSTADAESTSLCPGDISPSIGPGAASVCDAPAKACSHGTHVAGTVAGNDGIGPGYGVARGADIIAIQVFSFYGGPNPHLAKISDQIAALEHVLDLSDEMDIAAVNMSLGGGRYFDQEACDQQNAARKAAIDNLRGVGIATVISAGNSGYKDSIGTPGCISSAISVGATQDDDQVAEFSNIYPQIHLLAPGVDITSSIPGGGLDSFNGTSMAAPHVAGAFAVLKQRDPLASVGDHLALLQRTGDLVDDIRRWGVETNMRRINLGQALIGKADDSYARFRISNQADFSKLNISSIETDPSTPWIWVDPPAPLVITDIGTTQFTVRVDKSRAPEGLTQVRLLINSDDSNESPYPSGIYLNILRKGQAIFVNSFED